MRLGFFGVMFFVFFILAIMGHMSYWWLLIPGFIVAVPYIFIWGLVGIGATIGILAHREQNKAIKLKRKNWERLKKEDPDKAEVQEAVDDFAKKIASKIVKN